MKKVIKIVLFLGLIAGGVFFFKEKGQEPEVQEEEEKALLPEEESKREVASEKKASPPTPLAPKGPTQPTQKREVTSTEEDGITLPHGLKEDIDELTLLEVDGQPYRFSQKYKAIQSPTPPDSYIAKIGVNYYITLASGGDWPIVYNNNSFAVGVMTGVISLKVKEGTSFSHAQEQLKAKGYEIQQTYQHLNRIYIKLSSEQDIVEVTRRLLSDHPFLSKVDPDIYQGNTTVD